MALKSDGTVVAWGLKASVPPGMTGVVAVAVGWHHTLALKTDGTLAVWGDDDEVQCTVPAALNQVVAIAAGWDCSVALKNDGTVVAWGANNAGESTVPAGLSGVVAIAAGYCYTVALAIEPYSRVLGRFLSKEEAAVAQKQAAVQAADAARKQAADELAVADERRKKLQLALNEALEALAAENSKRFWQTKDFAKARTLLERAVILGSKEAKQELSKLPR